MAGTFSQIYVHVVFSVKGRLGIISEGWATELYKYITGVIKNKEQKLIAINGMPDHIHILMGVKPTCVISDLVREIKKSSNVFINEHNWVKGKFEWQSGYAVFSYSHSSLPNVIKYIENQKEHHKTKTFTEEYKEFMDKFNVEYKEDFLFD